MKRVIMHLVMLFQWFYILQGEHIFSLGYAEADGSGKSMINIGGSIPLNNIFRK